LSVIFLVARILAHFDAWIGVLYLSCNLDANLLAIWQEIEEHVKQTNGFKTTIMSETLVVDKITLLECKILDIL
jgi:hypothetical protein